MKLPLHNVVLVCHVNIVSLSENIGKLKEFLSLINFRLDVISISGTRLNNNNCNLVNSYGYCSFFKNSSTSAGGAAIVSKNIDCADNLSLRMNIDNGEDVWVDSI